MKLVLIFLISIPAQQITLAGAACTWLRRPSWCSPPPPPPPLSSSETSPNVHLTTAATSHAKVGTICYQREIVSARRNISKSISPNFLSFDSSTLVALKEMISEGRCLTPAIADNATFLDQVSQFLCSDVCFYFCLFIAETNRFFS